MTISVGPNISTVSQAKGMFLKTQLGIKSTYHASCMQGGD
jgi:hypothetical protein